MQSNSPGVILGVFITGLRSGPRAQAKGSRLKGQQQRESNPQSRAVRCGAFCRRARWPAQTSSRPTLWRPSGSAPLPGTATHDKHAWGAPAGEREERGLERQEVGEEEGTIILKVRNSKTMSRRQSKHKIEESITNKIKTWLDCELKRKLICCSSGSILFNTFMRPNSIPDTRWPDAITSMDLYKTDPWSVYAKTFIFLNQITGQSQTNKYCSE